MNARAAGLALLLACGSAFGQTVSMSGSLGDKALLIIDGTPSTVATGATVRGVKLVRVGSSDAVVEVKGQRIALQLGGAQVNIGGAPSAGGGSQIVMTANSGGHFLAQGSINGKSVTFMVDTGATYIAMGEADAERLGVDYTKGQRGVSSTANGLTASYRVKLPAVRIGDVVVYDVEAVVSPHGMSAILLGNSFLTRFQMKRENETMTLVKRY